jgi:hypothetical protein
MKNRSKFSTSRAKLIGMEIWMSGGKVVAYYDSG